MQAWCAVASCAAVCAGGGVAVWWSLLTFFLLAAVCTFFFRWRCAVLCCAAVCCAAVCCAAVCVYLFRLSLSLSVVGGAAVLLACTYFSICVSLWRWCIVMYRFYV